MYYNPETNDIKTKRELSLLYNVSIPNNYNKVDNYYLVHKEERPVISPYQIVTENPIEFKDEKYVLTYSVSYKPLNVIKELRYKEVEDLFNKASSKTYIVSSLGFKANADEVANRNVEGLIKVLKAENINETTFKDYDNEFHTVSLKDLETLQLEIIKNGQNLYTQKWKFINDISKMEDEKSLAFYSFTYTNMDFTK